MVDVQLPDSTPPAISALALFPIGAADVIDNEHERFMSVTSDGTSLYMGTQNYNDTAGVWRYTAGQWSKIGGSLSTAGFKGIGALLYSDRVLYAGTTVGSNVAYGGQVWSNDGSGWTTTTLVPSPAFNVAIRCMIEFQGSLFAAGCAYHIWKRTDGAWTTSYNATVTELNWTCFAKDDTYLYAAAKSLDNTAKVYRYNGTAWSVISSDGLGNANNDIIMSMKTYKNKLYVGTFNDSTGAEVWSYDGTTWAQVNTDGFGTLNNYNISSLEVVDNILVACTENPTGSQVWATIDGVNWYQKTITETHKYQGYMVASIGNVHYLVGTIRKAYTPTATPVQQLNSAQRAAKGVIYYPDGSMGSLPLGNNKYRIVVANSKYPLISEGPVTDVLETIKNSEVTPVDEFAGPRQTLTNLIKELQGSYNYIAGGQIYKDEESGLVLMVYHVEIALELLTFPNGGQYYQRYNSRLGIAVSFDDAESFYDCGLIIAPYEDAILANPSPSVVDITGGAIIVKDGYMHIYYKDYRSGYLPMAVARAPLADVLAAAANKTTTEWTKYYNGSFSETGIGGNASNLLPVDPAILWSTGFYSTVTNRYTMFLAAGSYNVDTFLTREYSQFKANVYAITSTDGIKWSMPERLVVQAAEMIYISTISPLSYLAENSSTFSLLGTVTTSADRWTNLYLGRWTVSSTILRLPTQVPVVYDVSVYVPPRRKGTIIEPDTSGWQGDVTPQQTRTLQIHNKIYNKVPLYPIQREEDFINLQVPTRIERISGIYKDLAPFSASIRGRKVSYFNEVFDTRWTIEDGVVKEKSFGPSSFDIYAEYEIRDLVKNGEGQYGTSQDPEVYILPLLLAVKDDLLYVLCRETSDGKAYYTLKICIAREPSNQFGYLESITDFLIDVPMLSHQFEDQIEEQLNTIGFSEKNPNAMLLTTNLGRQFIYRMYFDYYYNDPATNKLYLLESYPNAKIQVI